MPGRVVIRGAGLRGPQGVQGVRGPEGPLGPQGVVGPQGLPGTNAAPADAAVAGYITTAGTSATKAALESRFARLDGPLGTWRYKLETDPANAKVVMLGDSTSDGAIAATAQMYLRLRNLHTQQGEALYGMTPANIINGGNNGVPLTDWMAQPGRADLPFNRNALVAANPHLIVQGFGGINDIRRGALGTSLETCTANLIDLLEDFYDWARANLSGCFLHRIPNPLRSNNVTVLGDSSPRNYVTDGTNVNPAGLAQIYSTAMRRAGLYFVGRYPNVDVIDMQGEVFGSASVDVHPLIFDQLHPSGKLGGVFGTAGGLDVPHGGGYVAIADAVARRVGVDRDAFPPQGRARYELFVYRVPTPGTVQLINRDRGNGAVPASQITIDRAVSQLYLAGQTSANPTALTAATINPNVGGGILEISGLGSVAPLEGTAAIILGDHAPPTTTDRFLAFVPQTTVAAGAEVNVDLSVPGVRLNSAGNSVGIIPNRSADFITSGLRLSECYVRATDTVRLVFRNANAAGGADITVGGSNWTFWLIR